MKDRLNGMRVFAQVVEAKSFSAAADKLGMSKSLASLHVSFGFALVGAVVGEFLGARQGIGLMISTAQGAFNAAGVFAAMIVLPSPCTTMAPTRA